MWKQIEPEKVKQQNTINKIKINKRIISPKT